MSAHDTAPRPADEMRTAADRLRRTGEAATPGPWIRPLNVRSKAVISAPLPAGERPWRWRSGFDPDTGQREQVTVATAPTWTSGRHLRPRSGRDLEWIALLDPDLADPLADWLEWCADRADDATDKCNEELLGHALAVARLINRGTR